MLIIVSNPLVPNVSTNQVHSTASVLQVTESPFFSRQERKNVSISMNVTAMWKISVHGPIPSA